MSTARTSSAFVAAALTVGLFASACSSSKEATLDDLKSWVPTPANATKTVGPDPIANNGVQAHFQVGAAPGQTMIAYRNALKANGWDVTTIVTSGGGGGAGATYTATHGEAYGVFDGGGFDQQTFIDVCVWPKKPVEPNCTRAPR